MLLISSRLKMMADFIPEGEILVDIGTDHAYLPIYAIQNKKTIHAIAGEVNKGPYMRAIAHVEQMGLDDKISVRMGNGLEILQENEATIMTIAGMGGNLMVDILDAGYERLSSIKRLILQPMNSEKAVRGWLCEHGYTIVTEEILKEQDIIYEIIVAEPYAQNVDIQPVQLQFGPILLHKKADVFIEKWEQELEKLEKIKQNIIAKGSAQSIESRQNEIQTEIKTIKDVLTNDKTNH